MAPVQGLSTRPAAAPPGKARGYVQAPHTDPWRPRPLAPQTAPRVAARTSSASCTRWCRWPSTSARPCCCRPSERRLCTGQPAAGATCRAGLPGGPAGRAACRALPPRPAAAPTPPALAVQRLGCSPASCSPALLDDALGCRPLPPSNPCPAPRSDALLAQFDHGTAIVRALQVGRCPAPMCGCHASCCTVRLARTWAAANPARRAPSVPSALPRCPPPAGLGHAGRAAGAAAARQAAAGGGDGGGTAARQPGAAAAPAGQPGAGAAAGRQAGRAGQGGGTRGGAGAGDRGGSRPGGPQGAGAYGLRGGAGAGAGAGAARLAPPPAPPLLPLPPAPATPPATPPAPATPATPPAPATPPPAAAPPPATPAAPAARTAACLALRTGRGGFGPGGRPAAGRGGSSGWCQGGGGRHLG
jgi:hypothetical protein